MFISELKYPDLNLRQYNFLTRKLYFFNKRMGTVISYPVFTVIGCSTKVPFTNPLSVSILPENYTGDTTIIQLPDKITINYRGNKIYDISIDNNGQFIGIVIKVNEFGFDVVTQGSSINQDFYEIGFERSSAQRRGTLCDPNAISIDRPTLLNIRILRNIPGFAPKGTNYRIELYRVASGITVFNPDFLASVVITAPKSPLISN